MRGKFHWNYFSRTGNSVVPNYGAGNERVNAVKLVTSTRDWWCQECGRVIPEGVPHYVVTWQSWDRIHIACTEEVADETYS